MRSSVRRAARSPRPMRPPSRRCPPITTPSTTTSNGRGRTGTEHRWSTASRCLRSRPRVRRCFPTSSREVFLAFSGLSCSFLAEVNSGDTLYPQLQIAALTPGGPNGVVTMTVTVHNQRGELVLSGEHTYFLRRAGLDRGPDLPPS